MFNLPAANEVFALSASALYGKENYNISGNVAYFNTTGLLTHKKFFQGWIKGHGLQQLHWYSEEGKQFFESKNKPNDGFLMDERPLHILKLINSKNTEMTYMQKGRHKPLCLRLQVQPDLAKIRMMKPFSHKMKSLSKEKNLSSLSFSGTHNLRDEAKQKIEDSLATLKVKTELFWTLNQRHWFPKKMKEMTVLSYKWNWGNLCEKKISEIYFKEK